MSTTVFLVVLLAAALHAGWNAMAKISGDGLLAMGLISFGSGCIALMAAPFLGLPEPAAWPWLVASALIHIVYRTALGLAYNSGDMSLVYPIARGSGPLLATLGLAAVGYEILSPLMLAGVLLVAGSVILAGLSRAPSLMGQAASLRPVGLALLTGITIAAYTAVDGIGGRANNGNGMQYVVWLMMLDCFPFAAMVWWVRRAQFWPALRGQWKSVFGASGMSMTAYGLSIWGMSLAPIGAVAALRETSILFGILLARLWLKEHVGPKRLLAALGIVAGAVLLKL